MPHPLAEEQEALQAVLHDIENADYDLTSVRGMDFAARAAVCVLNRWRRITESTGQKIERPQAERELAALLRFAEGRLLAPP